MVIVAVALLAPAAASAGTFRWKTDGNGFWTDPANWQWLSGSVGAGYPNGRDDVAVFSFTISADRVVRIPSGISITIGTLQIAESFNLMIEGQGTTTPGKLIFDSSAASATLDVIGTSLINHEIRAPVDLRSDLTVDVFSSEGTVSFQRSIAQVGLVPRGVKKAGHGRARFVSPTANNYEGTTVVEEGMLEIFQSNTILGIPGDVEIGLADGDSPAELQVSNGNDVIRLGSRVRVLATGTFDVRHTSQSIAGLTMSGGFVTVGHISATGGFLSANSLTMTGGTLNVGTDTARYRLDGPATVTSSATQSAVIMGTGGLQLSATRTFNVLDGPLEQDLLMNLAIVDNGLNYGITKSGAGTMRFTGLHQNEYIGPTTVQEGRLDLARTSVATTIRGSLIVGGAGRQAEVAILESNTIQDNSPVSVLAGGVLTMTNASDRIGSLTLNEATATLTEGLLTTAGLSMTGATLQLVEDSVLSLNVVAVSATSTTGRTSVIGGSGTLSLNGSSRTFLVADGPEAIDLRIDAWIHGTGTEGLTKTQPGVALFTGRNEYNGNTAVNGGTLIVTGAIQGPVSVANNATLRGTGVVGAITAQSASTVSPGLSPGRLRSGALSLHPGSRFVVELLGPTAGTDYDQVRVMGGAEVQGSQLTLVAGPQLSPFGQFMLIDNDGTDPIAGAFDGLLEGATGAFFDEDVLIANPNTVDAPVTVTFLKEGGDALVRTYTIAKESRLTIRVDQIPALAEASVSVKVVSDARLPLTVERTMFWDATHYGGHTSNAVSQPERRWIFAEGSQGFFDTYVLLANANATATIATITFCWRTTRRSSRTCRSRRSRARRSGPATTAKCATDRSASSSTPWIR